MEKFKFLIAGIIVLLLFCMIPFKYWIILVIIGLVINNLIKLF
jgi:hypothetical protein